jgi:uncharacterized membrane protein
MASVSKTVNDIVVNVPIRTCYNQWTQFETFPRFMKAVEEVRQEGEDRVHWRVNIAGRSVEYDAQITEQIPDSRITWVSIAGDETGGTVTFEPLTEDRTRVTLVLRYAPRGLLEKVADLGGIVSMQAKQDLENFKEFIEQRGTATGGWRGAIDAE